MGIPVLNRNPLIIKVLDSILAFDYPLNLIKLVVVDGGSTDGTSQAASQWFSANQERFNSCTLLFERGLSAARNAVIREMVGNYLFFVDSDVIVPPSGLRFALEKLSQSEKVGMIGLPYREANSNIDTLHRIIQHKLPTRETFNINLGMGFTLIRRIAIEKVGPFNENVRMEDTEYSQRMIASGFKTMYSPAIEGLHYSDHPLSSMKFLKQCFFTRPKQIASLDKTMRKRLLLRHVYYGLIPIALILSGLFFWQGTYFLGLILLLYLGPTVLNQFRKTRSWRYRFLAAGYITTYITVESWGLLYYYLTRPN